MLEIGEALINISSQYYNFLFSHYVGGLYLFIIVMTFVAVFIHFGGRK